MAWPRRDRTPEAPVPPPDPGPAVTTGPPGPGTGSSAPLPDPGSSAGPQTPDSVPRATVPWDPLDLSGLTEPRSFYPLVPRVPRISACPPAPGPPGGQRPWGHTLTSLSGVGVPAQTRVEAPQ